MLAVDRRCHLLANIFDEMLGCFVFIDENVDFFGDGFIISCAKLINTGFDIVYIFFPVIFVDVAAFEHGEEAFVPLQPILHQFHLLFPRLALVENALVANSISHHHNAAACSVLADDPQRHYKGWPQCSLPIKAVSKSKV